MLTTALANTPQSALTTWGVMACMMLLCLLLYRRLQDERVGRLQSVLEMSKEVQVGTYNGCATSLKTGV